MSVRFAASAEADLLDLWLVITENTPTAASKKQMNRQDAKAAKRNPAAIRFPSFPTGADCHHRKIDENPWRSWRLGGSNAV